MLAVIGGTGLSRLPHLQVSHRQVVRTPYGDPSCALTFGKLGLMNLIFIARHGYGHSFAPHEINYRANMWALKELGAKGIVSVGAVVGIRPDLAPNTLVMPSDILDYTHRREYTFFEGPDQPVVHTDFSHPYDRRLQDRLKNAAVSAQVDVAEGGIYACTQGPRSETVAEIVKLERDGADMVGMTGMPEASLARELDMPYVHLCLVVNWAAGKGNGAGAVVMGKDNLSKGIEDIGKILLNIPK